MLYLNDDVLIIDIVDGDTYKILNKKPDNFSCPECDGGLMIPYNKGGCRVCNKCQHTDGHCDL